MLDYIGEKKEKMYPGLKKFNVEKKDKKPLMTDKQDNVELKFEQSSITMSPGMREALARKMRTEKKAYAF